MRKTPALLLFASCLAASFPIAAADGPGDAGAPRVASVGVGDIAPDFALSDQDGRKHVVSGARGKRTVVLVFYRGHW